jgi:hypothetical protein
VTFGGVTVTASCAVASIGQSTMTAKEKSFMASLADVWTNAITVG